MTAYSASSVLAFLIGLVVSTVVIYLVSAFIGAKKGLKTAFITAIIGSIIYAIVYFLLGNGTVAAIMGGITWLFALKTGYKIGWLHALVMAIIIWILTSIVGLILPTSPGPM
jgi:uncharacterized membrane protein YvlD (DUF360 family)